MAKRSDDDPLDFLGKRDSLVPQDAEGMKAYPTLAACLQPRWKDGKCVRQAGRMGLRVVGCYFLVSVTCPTEGLETTATLGSIVGLLDALEGHLRSPGAVWTPTFDRVKEAKAEEKKIRDELKKAQKGAT
jgi:hypothetical protein